MTHDLVQRTMLMFLGLWIVMAAGYASAENPADVNGTWVGSTVRGASTMTLVLKQTGNNVKGTIVGAGTADGPMDGTVDGNTIRLRFEKDTDQTPLLNVKGDVITGELSGTEITLRRVKSPR
jgi:hypothetical protein